MYLFVNYRCQSFQQEAEGYCRGGEREASTGRRASRSDRAGCILLQRREDRA